MGAPAERLSRHARHMFVRHAPPAICVVVCVLVGCGGQESDWYEQCSELDRQKDQRIKDLMSQGHTDEEARDIWGGEFILRQNRQAPSEPIEGEELKRALGD